MYLYTCECSIATIFTLDKEISLVLCMYVCVFLQDDGTGQLIDRQLYNPLLDKEGKRKEKDGY